MSSARSPVTDIRQLGYFVAIAETDAISSAAARLGISQPSLSEVLATLERRLGVQLLVRGPRGSQLTEAGFALARSGRLILSSLERAVEEARALGGAPGGPLAIGLPPAFALLLSVALAETMREEAPHARLRIVEAMSGYVLDWILSEHVDMGVIYEGQDCAGLESTPLLVEELFLAAAPDNWPAQEVVNGIAAEPVDLAALKDLPLVLPSRSHGLRELIERAARVHGVALNAVAEIDGLRHMVCLVSRASAYAILSQSAVLDEVARGELILVPIVRPTLKRTAYLARKRARPVKAASLIVEGLVSTILAELIQRHGLRAELPRIARAA